MISNPVILALTEQVSCYRRLAKLAAVQHQHVQDGQTEALLEVLRMRQVVIDELMTLEKVIGPAKQRWAQFAAGLDVEARGNAEQLLTETRTLLGKITASDKDDAIVLQQKKLNLGRQIKQTTTARQVNKNYAAAAYGKSTPRMDVHQ